MNQLVDKQNTRGEFNNASARRALVDWYLSLFIMCKAGHQYNERPRALALLNLPQVRVFDIKLTRLRDCTLNRSASLVMSTNVLKALPGKLDIKRHSPYMLYSSPPPPIASVAICSKAVMILLFVRCFFVAASVYVCVLSLIL